MGHRHRPALRISAPDPLSPWSARCLDMDDGLLDHAFKARRRVSLLRPDDLLIFIQAARMALISPSGDRRIIYAEVPAVDRLAAGRSFFAARPMAPNPLAFARADRLAA